MGKNVKVKRVKNAEKAAIVKIVADIYGVSARQVYRVINGDRKNLLVKITYESITNILTMARKHETERAAIVEKIATIHNISKRQVYRIINGDQINDPVLGSYMAMKEGIEDLSNQLVQAVEKLVPFYKS